MKGRLWPVKGEVRPLPSKVQRILQNDDGYSGRYPNEESFHRVPIGPALWDGAWRPL